MKEKTSKSVFSLSSAVKRLFVLDFSVRAFYYKHSDTTFQCKPICSFREIVNIKEVAKPHPNPKIEAQWPYAMQIDTLKSNVLVYFDTPQKLQKWKDALFSILEINTKIKKRRLSKGARSSDRAFSSSNSINLRDGSQQSDVVQNVLSSFNQTLDGQQIPKYQFDVRRDKS